MVCKRKSGKRTRKMVGGAIAPPKTIPTQKYTRQQIKYAGKQAQKKYKTDKQKILQDIATAKKSASSKKLGFSPEAVDLYKQLSNLRLKKLEETPQTGWFGKKLSAENQISRVEAAKKKIFEKEKGKLLEFLGKRKWYSPFQKQGALYKGQYLEEKQPLLSSNNEKIGRQRGFFRKAFGIMGSNERQLRKSQIAEASGIKITSEENAESGIARLRNLVQKQRNAGLKYKTQKNTARYSNITSQLTDMQDKQRQKQEAFTKLQGLKLAYQQNPTNDTRQAYENAKSKYKKDKGQWKTKSNVSRIAKLSKKFGTTYSALKDIELKANKQQPMFESAQKLKEMATQLRTQSKAFRERTKELTKLFEDPRINKDLFGERTKVVMNPDGTLKYTIGATNTEGKPITTEEITTKYNELVKKDGFKENPQLMRKANILIVMNQQLKKAEDMKKAKQDVVGAREDFNFQKLKTSTAELDTKLTEENLAKIKTNPGEKKIIIDTLEQKFGQQQEYIGNLIGKDKAWVRQNPNSIEQITEFNKKLGEYFTQLKEKLNDSNIDNDKIIAAIKAYTEFTDKAVEGMRNKIYGTEPQNNDLFEIKKLQDKINEIIGSSSNA